MLKKILVGTLSIIAITASTYGFANDDTCGVQIAVSVPAIPLEHSVAFNVTNGVGTSKSLFMKAGSPPMVIGNLNCSSQAYTVSATVFSNGLLNIQPIGEYSLKAGEVLLNGSNNSIAVVFPNDFIINP
jgi:hypothetical protein